MKRAVVQQVEIFGILNLTPDSFSDGGSNHSIDKALINANTMLEEGASYIDVGAESTRPNATPITDEEEWKRLSQILPRLLEAYPNKISLDSYHPNTVRKVLKIGEVIINDVTAFSNPYMRKIAAESKSRCIVSHIPRYVGSDVQKAHAYKKGFPMSKQQVREELLTRAGEMIHSGIDQHNIILDPGIGFGKSRETNIDLLSIANIIPNYEVMVGYSKKRFIGPNRLSPEANIEQGSVAIESGVKYLRLHQDLIPAHVELIKANYSK